MDADTPLRLDGWTCEAPHASREAPVKEDTLNEGGLPSLLQGPELLVEITRMDDGEYMAYEVPLTGTIDGYSLPSYVALGGFEGCTYGLSVAISLLAPEGCEQALPGGHETQGFQLLAEDQGGAVDLWDGWSVDVDWLRGFGVCGGGLRRGPHGANGPHGP